MRDLSRLFTARSIALFGGGWAENVIAQLQKSGYRGEIWPVHPRRDAINGVSCVKSIDELPGAPDASFIGVNREASIEVVRQLSAMGAGGATCFASGFLESESEGTGGADLQQKLVAAAGEMPILGPNCYGFLNYLDNVCLWPDQHGGLPVTSGIGIIAQSSNIAINMTMQRRGLPIAMLVAAGNQAQTGISDIAMTMLNDERISAIGLYLEGLGDLGALEIFAAEARAAGKPVVVLKTGKTESSRSAAITHTASMSGSADFSSALFRRLGFVEVEDVETFLETFKLLHHTGPLESSDVVSVSCSGGEAGLVADMADTSQIHFRPFSLEQKQALKNLLGPIVTIANPLDYHTFIWGNTSLMTDVFAAAMTDRFGLSLFVLDLPRDDLCDPSSYQCAVDAIIAAKKRTGAKVAVVSLLPENLSEALSITFSENGVVPLNGMAVAIKAIDRAIVCGKLRGAASDALPLAFGSTADKATVRSEADSKSILAANGVRVPRSVRGGDVDALINQAVEELAFPVVLKVEGIAHKSEAGGVVLNLSDENTLRAAFREMPEASAYLIEEMINGALCELIVGVSREEAGLQMLTVGAGGIYAEILKDKVNLLLPVRESEVESALRQLRIWPMLDGYRGKPKADLPALVDAIMAIASFAGSDGGRTELDVNPLIVREKDCVAVDALIVEWK